jgi:hypothetical protein
VRRIVVCKETALLQEWYQGGTLSRRRFGWYNSIVFSNGSDATALGDSQRDRSDWSGNNVSCAGDVEVDEVRRLGWLQPSGRRERDGDGSRYCVRSAANLTTLSRDVIAGEARSGRELEWIRLKVEEWWGSSGARRAVR